MLAVTVGMVIVIGLFTTGMVLLKKSDPELWDEMNSVACNSSCYIPGGYYNSMM